MNAKIMAYMVAAVAVGYLLISAVPEQVSMFAGPQEMLRAGEIPSEESGGPMLASGTEGGELGALEDHGFKSLFDLYKWWAIDLVVAFSVYWVARRRFT
ncbi:MAG: hypothetical protein V1924_02465 [Candidatus Bathyarchaeota archaeon]